MPYDSLGHWPPNVTPLPQAKLRSAEAQRDAFDALVASIHTARAHELVDKQSREASSEALLSRLMAMPATDGDQLGVKLRLFSVELAKEAEFGQNPDFRLIPFFAAIQRDCIRLLHARLPDEASA
jgi:hypothetical protein